MKTRHFLARTAAVLTASAAIGLCLVPGGAEEARDDLDGWGNRDLDIGAFSQATANGIGSILDGWANRDLDIGALSQAPATSNSTGSILDGWANRDLDIGAFSQATANGIGSILDGWANRDLDVGPFAQGLPQSGDRSSISG